jgi:hypothetical protein
MLPLTNNGYNGKIPKGQSELGAADVAAELLIGEAASRERA